MKDSINSKNETVNAYGNITDITEIPMHKMLLTEASDPKAMASLKKFTDARIGIGRAGSRFKTIPYLRFRADHAAANDAVMLEVEKETIASLGMFEIRTKCENKFDMLTRPDWGRIIPDEYKAVLLEKCKKDIDVQIYCGDGLSAPSIGANVGDLLKIISLSLEGTGISIGTPFFVRYCRVNTAREIAPLLKAKVTCVLIGERPGLSNGESMSAYIAYNARPEMSESDYTVVSNISRKGMHPTEAGAYIAELIIKMLEQKASGLGLKI